MNLYNFLNAHVSFMYTVPLYDWHHNMRCKNCGKKYTEDELRGELFCIYCCYSGETTESVSVAGHVTGIKCLKRFPDYMTGYLYIELDREYTFSDGTQIDTEFTLPVRINSEHVILDFGGPNESITFFMVRPKV